MSSPESRIRIQISDSFVVDGIAVRMSVRHSETEVLIGKVNQNGSVIFEPYDASDYADPGVTLALSNDFARALLDALLRHYQGASDMHTVRSDYLNERDRVDRVISMYTKIATQAIGRIKDAEGQG